MSKNAQRLRCSDRRYGVDKADKRGARTQSSLPLIGTLAEAYKANKTLWEQSKPHNGSFSLSVPWKTYLKTHVAPWKTVSSVGISTGAFIQWPKISADQVLYIWGDDAQVLSAVDQLRKHFRSPDHESYRGGRPSASNENDGQPTRSRVVEPKKHKWAELYSTMNVQQEAKAKAEEMQKGKEKFALTKFDHDLAAEQVSTGQPPIYQANDSIIRATFSGLRKT
jgi:hypothetical protein